MKSSAALLEPPWHVLLTAVMYGALVLDPCSAVGKDKSGAKSLKFLLVDDEVRVSRQHSGRMKDVHLVVASILKHSVLLLSTTYISV